MRSHKATPVHTLKKQLSIADMNTWFIIKIEDKNSTAAKPHRNKYLGFGMIIFQSSFEMLLHFISKRKAKGTEDLNGCDHRAPESINTGADKSECVMLVLHQSSMFVHISL
jgi:hypothetical protein